jgi:hypothetical protein
LQASLTTLLSPFDPLVWDRARALAMFGFDYRLECYTPSPKRRWGYFVLPLLRRGELVGRVDAKAHRKTGEFEVKALYLEDGVQPDDALVRDVAGALRDAADWHGTPDVLIRRTAPVTVAAGAAGGGIVMRALAGVRSGGTHRGERPAAGALLFGRRRLVEGGRVAVGLRFGFLGRVVAFLDDVVMSRPQRLRRSGSCRARVCMVCAPLGPCGARPVGGRAGVTGRCK